MKHGGFFRPSSLRCAIKTTYVLYGRRFDELCHRSQGLNKIVHCLVVWNAHNM